LFTVHPRCVGEFEQKLDEFTKTIGCLPPLALQAQEVKAHV
jgi:hypothetical protein